MSRRQIITACFLLMFCVAGCVPDNDLKTSFNMEPASLNDGWSTSTPAAEGLDKVALQEVYERLFSEDEYITAISLLVVRNGKLVAEGYFRSLDDRHTKRQIQSVTKSITSLVFGIAWEMEYFDDLDQRLYDIVPEAFDDDLRKREITLRHLLTMRACLKFWSDEFAQEMQMNDQKNVMKYILAKPLFADPGTLFNYRDCDPQLLGGAVSVKTDMTLEEIAKDRLFSPMGIVDYYWEKNADGDNWAAQALYMRSRDLAKIGKLVMNRGNWQGEQLISEDWIEQATSIQTPQYDGQPEDGTDPFYGFYWWIYPHMGAFTALGAGGQYIFIIPDKNLVIVMTSEPYVEDKLSLESDFFDLALMIIDSIID
ncbi:MAG: serine hydrolase [Fidelibacterota bacterium]|nr:MAG: serine hydrolase [Candidatus Neomarinimicrobiota bacterium]